MLNLNMLKKQFKLRVSQKVNKISNSPNRMNSSFTKSKYLFAFEVNISG